MIKIGGKEKIDNVWRELEMKHFAGKTLRDAFLGLDGREVVIKFTMQSGDGFLCGTDELVAGMLKRGDRAFRLDQAVLGIEKGPNREILEEIVITDEQYAVFGEEAVLEDFNWDSPTSAAAK